MITFHAHHGDGFISKLIRTMSPQFNHISVEIDDVIFEAHIKHGVTRTYIGDWDNSTVAASISFNCSTKTLGRIWEFLNRQVGKKYDLLGIFSFIWRFIPQKNGQWYCSELGYVVSRKMLNIHSNSVGYNQKKTPDTCWGDLIAIKRATEPF